MDPKLRELEKWAQKTLKQPEDEPVLYSEFDNATVERLLHEIAETAAYMEKRNKPPFSVAIVVDDFAEIPQVVRGPHLTSLFLKGRHWGCSTFVSSQSYRMLSPAIRKNAISLLVGRLRTESDVLAIADELGGSVPGGKRSVEELIKRITTSAPHSFLYVDLSASPEKMFHANWEPLSLADL